MNDKLMEEFEEWYLKHSEIKTEDLEKVIRNGEYVYFYTTAKIMFEQFCEIKKLNQDNAVVLDWRKLTTKVVAKMASFGNHSGQNEIVNKIGRIIFPILEKSDERTEQLENLLSKFADHGEKLWLETNFKDGHKEISSDLLNQAMKLMRKEK